MTGKTRTLVVTQEAFSYSPEMVRDEQTGEVFILTPENTSAIYGCTLTFGVQIKHDKKTKRITITPVKKPWHSDSEHERKYLERAAVGWLRQVAPNRLVRR